MTRVALGSGGEFDRIRAIAMVLGDTLAPIGDDTATVPPGDGSLVVSVDATVENVHFKRNWLSMEEVGWRAAASALSDLAAAGATPIGVLTALIVPSADGAAMVVDVMRGVGSACDAAGARVIGGDLSSGAIWSIAVTVLGRVKREIGRGGARPGDGIWVTGSLGGAHAAVESWRAGHDPDAEARYAFVHPEPRIAAGLWLAEHGATAMMDISDGLGGDAEHLAAASNVSLDIALESIPVHPGVAREADRAGEDPAVFAATGGEDYELLVTMPAGFDSFPACRRATGIALTRIGTVREGSGVLTTLRGTIRAIGGFRHAI
jgi:thiamine-monophosphate kinase